MIRKKRCFVNLPSSFASSADRSCRRAGLPFVLRASISAPNGGASFWGGSKRSRGPCQRSDRKFQKTYRCAPRCRSLPPALVRWYVWLAQEAEERHCKIKTPVSGFGETAEIRKQGAEAARHCCASDTGRTKANIIARNMLLRAVSGAPGCFGRISLHSLSF